MTGMPVLLSFASYSPWLDRYHQGFDRILVDSGAYSELSGGVKVDVLAYRDWAERWNGHADACAGLDDIRGDWRRSMRNYEAMPRGFPTFHDSDPPPATRRTRGASARARQLDRPGSRASSGRQGAVDPRRVRQDPGRPARSRMGSARLHTHSAARLSGFYELVARRHGLAPEPSVAQLRRVPGDHCEAVRAVAAFDPGRGARDALFVRRHTVKERS